MSRVRIFLLFFLILPLFITVTVLTVDAKKKVRIPKSPSFVGAVKCDGSCHDPWYQAWIESPHGQTYNILKAGERSKAKKKAEALIKEKLVKYGGRDQAFVDKLDVVNTDFTKEPFCLRCHSTGFGQKGGFNPDDAEIDPDEPNLEQVGCEMCHSVRGGAQFRALMKKTEGDFTSAEAEKLGKRYDNWTGNVCKRCHEHENTPFQPSVDKKYKFNFEERRKKVHEYKKFVNDDNRDQLLEKRKNRVKEDPGVTEKKNLVIEDWVIQDGKVRFKALPLYKGILRFQDGSKLPLKEIKVEKP